MLRQRLGLLKLMQELDWRRLAAGLLVSLLTILTFDCGYVAAQQIDVAPQIEGVDVATVVVDEPLADTTVAAPGSTALPLPSADGIGGPEVVVFEACQLCPARERGPPSLSL